MANVLMVCTNTMLVFVVLGFVATAHAQQALSDLLPTYANNPDLTHQCLSNNGATNFGSYATTDQCCAEHNKCQRVGPQQLLTCTCEDAFRNCLRVSKPSPGENIFRTKLGKAYYNQVAPKCVQQGGIATCVLQVTNMLGELRCGKYSVTPGTKYLTLDNKFYEEV